MRRPLGHCGARRSAIASSPTRGACSLSGSAATCSQPRPATSPPCDSGKERVCTSPSPTAVALIPAPHSTKSCVRAAPAVEAKALRVRPAL